MEAPQQQYPPEYLAEDRSRVLLNLVIAFIVLETTFFTLFMTARYMNRTLNGWDVYFMIPAYLAAMGHCIVAPSKYPSFMTMKSGPICGEKGPIQTDENFVKS